MDRLQRTESKEKKDLDVFCWYFYGRGGLAEGLAHSGSKLGQARLILELAHPRPNLANGGSHRDHARS